MPVVPEISVVVITYDRPSALRACLQSLAAQSFSRGRFEVVVVDGSARPAADLDEEFRGSLNLNHVVRPNAGVAVARNRGARAAVAPFLAFIDDDCVAEPHWLEKMHEAVLSQPRCLVGGDVANGGVDNVFAVAGQAIAEAVDNFYNPPGSAPRFFPGLNFAVSRELYRSIGGCDEGFGLLAAEDRDFIDRWKAAGYTLTRCREAVVKHFHRGSLREFARQYFSYGRGAFHYHRLRLLRGTGNMREDTKLHRQLCRHFREPLRRVPSRMRVQVLALLGLWQAANLAGFLFEAALERRASKFHPASDLQT